MKLSRDVKNYADRGECWPRWITASEISIILGMIRKPNSLLVILFIQNISKFLTSLPIRKISSKTLAYIILGKVSGYKQTFFL